MFEALFKYSREDFARSELVYLGEWPDWILYGLAFVAVAGITALLFYAAVGAVIWLCFSLA